MSIKKHINGHPPLSFFFFFFWGGGVNAQNGNVCSKVFWVEDLFHDHYACMKWGASDHKCAWLSFTIEISALCNRWCHTNNHPPFFFFSKWHWHQFHVHVLNTQTHAHTCMCVCMWLGGWGFHVRVGHVMIHTHGIQHTAIVIIFTWEPSNVKKILH